MRKQFNLPIVLPTQRKLKFVELYLYFWANFRWNLVACILWSKGLYWQLSEKCTFSWSKGSLGWHSNQDSFCMQSDKLILCLYLFLGQTTEGASEPRTGESQESTDATPNQGINISRRWITILALTSHKVKIVCKISSPEATEPLRPHRQTLYVTMWL